MSKLKNCRLNEDSKKTNDEIKKESFFKCHFTTKESIILCEVIKGYNNKTIAQKLYLSCHTVKFYVQSLLIKTNSHSRTEMSAKILMILIGKKITPDFLFEYFGSNNQNYKIDK